MFDLHGCVALHLGIGTAQLQWIKFVRQRQTNTHHLRGLSKLSHGQWNNGGPMVDLRWMIGWTYEWLLSSIFLRFLLRSQISHMSTMLMKKYTRDIGWGMGWMDKDGRSWWIAKLNRPVGEWRVGFTSFYIQVLRRVAVSSWLVGFRMVLAQVNLWHVGGSFRNPQEISF